MALHLDPLKIIIFWGRGIKVREGASGAPIKGSSGLAASWNERMAVQQNAERRMLLGEYHPNISNNDTRNTKKDCLFQVCLVSMNAWKDLRERTFYGQQELVTLLTWAHYQAGGDLEESAICGGIWDLINTKTQLREMFPFFFKGRERTQFKHTRGSQT